MRIDPTIPVHRQPTLTVRPPGDCILHRWFTYANGVECPKCDALLLRKSGRRSYRGRHRMEES